MNVLTDSIPLNVKHISYVVKDVNVAAHHFNVIMGFQFNRQFDAVFANGMVRGKAAHFEAKIAVAELGTFAFELLQPVKGNTIWKEFLDEKGEGMHHFGALVTDLDSEISRFKALGVDLLQWGETEHAKVAFFDTSKTTGMLLELIQHK
jgi:methylmalonyl-CoA/ethylmalonyl-CoA epimerase